MSEEVLLARVAWSRLAEPGDLVAGAVVAALGPVDALAWLRDAAPAAVAGVPVRLDTGEEASAGESGRRLAAAVRRWVPRLAGLTPERDLETVRRLGGQVVTPEDPGWPGAMSDLGHAAPACLWVRSEVPLDGLLRRAVAVIGARACTAYGEHVTAQIVAGLADGGWTVVSGGAYGIDAVAHRTAVAFRGGATVAFLAGGVDRPYPAGNARLLAAIVAEGGAVVSEVPPGSVPSRSRFLLRNRLSAAGGQVTVVVEAAWRSGALSTAGHAADLLRPVGAVPGPVTSAASAGCHRLLRDGLAVCVTDAAEVIELAGAPGAGAAGSARAVDVSVAPARNGPPEHLDDVTRRTWEALPVRQAASAESLARVAGLSVPEVLAGLGLLELAGHAVRVGETWSRPRRHATSGQTRTNRAPAEVVERFTG